MKEENIEEIIENIKNNRDKLFERNSEDFLGKPFYLDYDTARILVSDSERQKVDGLQRGSFLLAFYDNDLSKKEVILLRTIGPVGLPQEKDVFTSIIEYYKDNFEDKSIGEKMDPLTRYDFSFSGVECNVLGTFYEDEDGNVVFGSDIDNYYTATNYTVYKPRGETLELIVNFGLFDEDESNNYMKIGVVKYSSTSSSESLKSHVLVPTSDLIGKRTALFGKTRTGKSNTIKKIIQMVDEVSDEDNPIGQIVFDINGEYANPNQQDEGTSISDMLESNVEKYSVIQKEGFKVLKTNFYLDVKEGFEILKSEFDNENKPDYMDNFLSIDLTEPRVENFDSSDDFFAAKTRYDRLRAAYLCCLHKAGFKEPDKPITLKFSSHKHIDKEINPDLHPKKGLTLDEGLLWFGNVWKRYYEDDFFTKEHIKDHGREWADEELKAVLTILTGLRQNPTVNGASKYGVNGHIKLAKFKSLHTTSKINFKTDIMKSLRKGKIVLVDLSQGNEKTQSFYSEILCKHIFEKAISNFTKNKHNNFIQFYFEEAHNLFPKKDTKDLSQIYNRIAKEGAKLHLGLVYATQEVSSISSNILKNTENWFISHLNNTEELHEIKKFDDFEDVADSLKRFSPKDKGFVRMKVISSPYVVPVQIDKFGEQ